MPIRLSFPGFTQQNANPDLGDSAIVESVGSGGFSLAESPALVKLVGGSVADTITYSREDVRHYGNAQPAMSLPSLDFAWLPIGIDVRKVAHTGIRPLIITGIVHKQAGAGQIGAGIVRAPIAVEALNIEPIPNVTAR